MDLINGTEQEIAQALGVELPQNNEGGNERDIADPAEGQQVQEPNATEPRGAAEPDGGPAPAAPSAGPSPTDDGQEEDDAGENGTDGQDGQQAGADGKPLSAEERKANAARRRQQETQAAVDAAVAAERARLEREYQQRERQLFADADLKDSIHGKPITNREEFYAWKKAYDDTRLQKNLAAGKLTPEDLDRAISANPAVRQAQEAAERQEQAERQRQQAEMRARADQEIAEIGKLDPSVKSLQDILSKPTGRAFCQYVQKGNTFLDAYRLANWEELTARQQQAAAQRQAEAARQQAMANARGKGHLNPIPTGRGEGAVPVPESEMKYFRALLGGDATEAEIRSAYNDYMKTKN